jgi:type IV pilus assembly protein PilN
VIRVNLLPQKRDARSAASPQASQKWLLLVVAVIVLEIIGLFLFHQHKIDQLDKQRAQNEQLQSQINDIRKFVANHEEIKKQLVVLRAREDAIAKLQLARSGPTAVLLELAQLLTPGKGPTADPDRLQQLRKDNPLSVYNPGWDSRRLWLSKYDEKGRVVTIEGLARDGGDVYELAQRLKLSSYFYDVKLLEGKKEPETTTKVELVKFALELKVRY